MNKFKEKYLYKQKVTILIEKKEESLIFYNFNNKNRTKWVENWLLTDKKLITK